MFFLRELKAEIHGKTCFVTFDCLIENLCGRAVKIGKVSI